MRDRSEPLPSSLTRREAAVLGLVVRGLSSQQTADHLGLSKRTVDDHLSNVYSKLGVVNRVQALHAAVRLGVVPREIVERAPPDEPPPPQA